MSSTELANVTHYLRLVYKLLIRKALEVLKSALAPMFDGLTNTTEGAIVMRQRYFCWTISALGSINAVAGKFAEASDIITAIQRTGGVFASASKGGFKVQMLLMNLYLPY